MKITNNIPCWQIKTSAKASKHLDLEWYNTETHTSSEDCKKQEFNAFYPLYYQYH